MDLMLAWVLINDQIMRRKRADRAPNDFYDDVYPFTSSRHGSGLLDRIRTWRAARRPGCR